MPKNMRDLLAQIGLNCTGASPHISEDGIWGEDTQQAYDKFVIERAIVIDRKAFYDSVRFTLFSGRLTQSQVNGLTTLLDYWQKNLQGDDIRWLAYVLATAHHETAAKIQPINEYGSNEYFFDRYDPNGSHKHIAKALGNTQSGDGVKFHGRGFVQLTGRKNYQDWANRLNIDLINNPELAQKTEVAARILFEGMQLGTFTGKKLVNYFDGTINDPINARRIVNGTDKAELIADYYKKYLEALI